MEMKKELIEQYDLPNLECQRWGTNKGFTRTDLLRGMLWNVFARFIRRRDAGKCISCSQTKTYEQLQAGHYVPVGGSSVDFWFSEVNTNGECESCNAWDSFHLIPMRANLIVKWGETAVQTLEVEKQKCLSVKWEERDYVELIKRYCEELKEL